MVKVPVAETAGRLNALRVLTKNVLAIVVDEERTIDWGC